IASRLRVIDRPEDDKRQQPKRGDYTNETQFFPDDRKDEIRVPGRQKSELVLRTSKEAFAQQTARTNCDLRLCDLITLTQGISLRIKESHDAFLLVMLSNNTTHRKE